MTDTTDTTDSETTDEATTVDTTADESAGEDDPQEAPGDDTDDPETFPREYVENLRQENGRYRQRAQQADTYAQRLHTELVRATGKLADPTDLPFDEEHLAEPERLSAAVDDLLARKPHLASRKPAGDIGQGGRGSSDAPLGLLDLLKSRT